MPKAKTGTVERDGGPMDATAIVRKHDNLIRSFAWLISSGGADRDDLIQEGRIALLTAIGRFDASRGVALWTFARPFVVGAMLRWASTEAQYPLAGRQRQDHDDRNAIGFGVGVVGAATVDEAHGALRRYRFTLSDVDRDVEIREGMSKLPARERWLVEDVVAYGETIREVATTLQQSTGNVHRQVQAALTTLRERSAP